MGRDFFDRYASSRKAYETADNVLGMDLAKLCFEGPQEDLDRTSLCQPAILATSVAVFRAMEEEHGEVVAGCEATAGLSLGEYTALVFAGAMDYEPALRLVRRRGEFMEEAGRINEGGMLSIIGLDIETVQGICRDAGEATPANFNCPGQIVVSGTHTALEKTATMAKKAGAKKVIPLKVSGAFHSSLMQPAADKLMQELDATEFRRPRMRVVANASAGYVEEPAQIRASLVKQLISCVLWEQCCRVLLDDGCSTFYEPGPGRVLAGLMRRIEPGARVTSVNRIEAVPSEAGGV